MMSNDICRGKRMKGETPSIFWNERPMLPLSSSSIWRCLMGMDRHLISSGGLIGGVLSLPPSKTIISESISLIESFTWVNGTTISRRRLSILRDFFLARRRRRWKTVGDSTSTVATAAHCVRREEFARDFEKVCTHGGGGLEKLYGREQGSLSLATMSFLSFKVSSVWHLEPYETVTCVKGSQWTLSLMIFEVELGFGSMEDLFLVLVKILVSWGTNPTFSFKRSLRWQWYGGTNPSFRVERSLRRPCSETTKLQQKHY